MLFSPQLPPAVLVSWCRTLKHGVDMGLSPVKIFRQQAKSGPAAGRELADRLADRLAKGKSLTDAARADRPKFPTLFLELVAVGEETGRLTETFEALEDHFETTVKSRKLFYAAIVWPSFMYVAAVFVIAFMVLILGLLAPAGGQAFDPLGLGLVGVPGALVWLAAAGTVTAGVVIGFLFVRGNDSVRAKVESGGLGVPGLAGCFRAFALNRFSTALHMTGEAGLSADRALKLSLRATANDAYAKQADWAAKQARGGQEIAPTLQVCGVNLFPADYVEAVEVGETAGRLPEVMARLAVQYRDEAARKLKFLAGLAGGLVYAMVGLMVIVLIVRILMSIAGVYQEAFDGIK